MYGLQYETCPLLVNLPFRRGAAYCGERSISAVFTVSTDVPQEWLWKPAEWHSMAIRRTARRTAAPRALPARSSAPQLLRLLI
eukprot:scaffold109316_cov56-Phaeocystis_antarctica.AAC.3